MVYIFDVNGVLIDSNLANARAMAEVFSCEESLRQEIVSLYLNLTGIDRGSKIRIIQEKIIGRPFAEGEFDTCWETFKKKARLAMSSAPLTPGCREVLHRLGEKGVTRVALSNTPLRELQEVLAVHGLDRLLDIVRGGGDWPKSESLAMLLHEYRLNPRECCFFGDGKGDLSAARYAGVPFVAIDKGTGEFAGEVGFQGPFTDLEDWARNSWDLFGGK